MDFCAVFHGSGKEAHYRVEGRASSEAAFVPLYQPTSRLHRYHPAPHYAHWRRKHHFMAEGPKTSSRGARARAGLTSQQG